MAIDTFPTEPAPPRKPEAAEEKRTDSWHLIGPARRDDLTAPYLRGLQRGSELTVWQLKPQPEPEERSKEFGTTAAAENPEDQAVDSNLCERRVSRLPQREMVFLQPSSPKPSKLDASAQRIIRKHFVEKILNEMLRIQNHSGQPSAVNYVQRLFNTIRQARDSASSDPFLPVLMALHDALAYENRWADYTAPQYDAARRVLTKYANQEVFPEKVEKAIMELEDIGFDTTPFAIQTADDE